MCTPRAEQRSRRASAVGLPVLVARSRRLAFFRVHSVKTPYSSFSGYAHLSAGLSCGLSGLGAGLAIGIVGDAGVRANGIQPKLFVPMVLILIFAEALGLYGLIVGIILSQQTQTCTLPTVQVLQAA